MANDSIKPQILIIEDEISICIAVKDLLEIYNYNVEYAINAEEGIKYLEENPQTDVILLDINLGTGLDGVKVLSIIREKFKYVQIIMFSSMTTIDTGIECMKKGAMDYITKPYDEADLLKKIATALERKKIEQMNDLYLGILVHDLKNPLQNIMGALEVVNYTLGETLTDQQKKFLASADRGVSQIKTMINNILSVSKFENGTLNARREGFPLKKVVSESLETLKNEADYQQKGLSLNFSIAEDYTICTDKEFFSQILTNIVSNALRYTPPDGEVFVNLKNTGGDLLHVSVTNTGSFIEESERKAIFDKFSSVQLEKKRSNSQNYGLGLTYCKMAVDAMDGKIWVDGNKDIPETTFHFTIKNRKDS